MTEHFIDRIIAELRELDDKGSKDLPNGTRLIRRVDPLPDGTFSNAYQHEFFAPLHPEQVSQLEKLVQRPIPDCLTALLVHCNGLVLFSGSLSVSGMRFDYSRSTEDEARQPVSLEYGNVWERPLEGPEGQERFADNSDQLRFGFFGTAAAEAYMKEDGDPRIYAVPRHKVGPILYQWPNLEAMLTSEVDRMIDLYRRRQGRVNAFNPLPAPWQEQQ